MPKETVPPLVCSRGRIAGALVALLTFSAGARAAPTSDRAGVTEPSSRHEVLFAMLDNEHASARGVLSGLLRSELAALGLTLIEDEPGPNLSRWAESSAHRDRTLLAVLLDARSSTGWRLVIIDATRDRAIARDLSGGIEENAASVEAVVSIVVSAANALQEGLEVASTPIRAVVDPAPAVRIEREPDTPRPSRQERGHTALHGGVALVVSSFSSEAPTTQGLSVALGISLPSMFELRVSAARHWPARISGPYGEFRIDRSFLGLSAGPRFVLGALVLTPEAGVTAEWLERSETTARAGVTAHDDRTTARVGGWLGVGASRKIFGPLSLELRLGAAYFGQSVEFVAETPGPVRLTEAWPMVLLTQLGLDVSTR